MLGIYEYDGTVSNLISIHSDIDLNFIYTVGETIKIGDFDVDVYKICYTGIHFFINREKAIEYGKSLGRTDHHFNNAIAFKFEDELYETELLDIEYEVSRNGEMVPVAIFNPIQIEGTTIQRCSLFNLSVLENKLGKPYIGQKIWISKRNMVIPYIEEAEKASE